MIHAIISHVTYTKYDILEYHIPHIPYVICPPISYNTYAYALTCTGTHTILASVITCNGTHARATL